MLAGCASATCMGNFADTLGARSQCRLLRRLCSCCSYLFLHRLCSVDARRVSACLRTWYELVFDLGTALLKRVCSCMMSLYCIVECETELMDYFLEYFPSASVFTNLIRLEIWSVRLLKFGFFFFFFI